MFVQRSRFTLTCSNPANEARKSGKREGVARRLHDSASCGSSGGLGGLCGPGCLPCMRARPHDVRQGAAALVQGIGTLIVFLMGVRQLQSMIEAWESTSLTSRTWLRRAAKVTILRKGLQHSG